MGNIDNKQKSEDVKSKVQDLAEKLINDGKYSEALSILEQYNTKIPGDPDICSMIAVAYLVRGQLDKAEQAIAQGLAKDTIQFDLIYNLAYIYEMKNEYEKAADLYMIADSATNNKEMKNNVKASLERIKAIDSSIVFKEKKKLVFFVKDGMNNFFEDIIEGLSNEYLVRKMSVNDYKQIDTGMEWADVCWFEWCDELIVYASRSPLAKDKKIICRIHGYEVYTNAINSVNWNNVDKLIIVAPHIKRIFLENMRSIPNVDIELVYCGVNTDKYPLRKRTKGFNIGYLGYINFKKNIPLTLEIFKMLHNIDKRYKLHLAGQFQDERTFSYFKYFIREYKLEDAVFFEGWKDYDQKLEFLDKLDYMVISSIDEGLCYAAAEAMCSGIKPILHNCEGIKDHYIPEYIFNSVDEAVDMIQSDEYDSYSYRKYVEDRFSSSIEISKIKSIIQSLL
ncbi:MAG: glycosyltransferase [Clostridiaceae bacterium]|nr:glycosyltransferase [Clostridiaceae bacterium]